MESQESFGSVTIYLALIVLVGCIAGMAGRNDARDEIRTQAVERGFAERVVQPDGSTEFKWKESE